MASFGSIKLEKSIPKGHIYTDRFQRDKCTKEFGEYANQVTKSRFLKIFSAPDFFMEKMISFWIHKKLHIKKEEERI